MTYAEGRSKPKKSKKDRVQALRSRQEQMKIFREICPIKPNYTVPHTNIAIKNYFYEAYGCRCWLCGEVFPRNELTLHHVIPYHISQRTNVEESSIVCCYCHFDIVNKIPYNSEEYWSVMQQMYNNIKQWNKESL